MPNFPTPPLVFAVLLLGGCTEAPNDAPLACSTPADSTAAADITITSRDSLLHILSGDEHKHFDAWTYDGEVPGPVLRMTLGETKRVKLVNDSPRPNSLHFHGVHYSDSDDGSLEHPESMVNPGCAHVYTLTAVQPGVWPYHSHRESRTEMAFGMYGAVIVPDPAEATADHEFVVFLGQLGLEMAMATGEEAEHAPDAPFFAMTINGRPFANASLIELNGDHYDMTPATNPQAKVGQRVRWRVLNVSPDDLHTFHIHGHRWCNGRASASSDPNAPCPSGALPTDNVDLAPAMGTTAEFVEDNPGTWMYHCHILDHVNDGMFAFYDVIP